MVHVEISSHVDSKEHPGQKETTFTCSFAPNEFFDNDKLTAKLLYDKDELLKSVGTEIKWKKNPTINKITKTQKNKRSGQTRTITKEEQLRTFFEIFNDYVPDEEKDEEEGEGMEPRLDLYALEETLDDLSESLPYALEYYLGVVDEDEDDYDEEGEDGDEDEEEDDEDEEDHRHANKKKSKGNSRKASEHAHPKTDTKADSKADPKAGEKKQECKQQ